MVSPSSRRRAVKSVVEEGLGSAVQACRALGLARSSFYRPCLVSLTRRRVDRAVLKLSEQHPRYGYRRITALLRRDGLSINAKRVQRLRRREGMQVRERQKRMRRLGLQQNERLRAMKPRQVWSWDLWRTRRRAERACAF
jgi:putative transposase